MQGSDAAFHYLRSQLTADTTQSASTSTLGRSKSPQETESAGRGLSTQERQAVEQTNSLHLDAESLVQSLPRKEQSNVLKPAPTRPAVNVQNLAKNMRVILGTARKVKSLELRNTAEASLDLSGVLSRLSNKDQVEKLTLVGGREERFDWSILKQFPNLVELKLENFIYPDKLASGSDLGKFGNKLLKLRIQGEFVPGATAAVKHLIGAPEKLEELAIEGDFRCYHFRDTKSNHKVEELDFLLERPMPNLKSLSLGGGHAESTFYVFGENTSLLSEPKAKVSFPKLVSLRLENVAEDDTAGRKSLAKFLNNLDVPKLQDLSLARNNLRAGFVPMASRQRFPELKRADLSNNKLEADHLREVALGSSAGLELLDVRDNNLGSKGRAFRDAAPEDRRAKKILL